MRHHPAVERLRRLAPVLCCLTLLLNRAAIALPVFPNPVVETDLDPRAVAIGDFDNDSLPDLAVVSFDLDIYLGNGDATFRSPTHYSVGVGPRSMVVGDFNGDGDLDLAVANWDSSDISILLGLPGGAFAPEHRFSVGRAPENIAVGDFNRDGRPDLVTANSNSDDISVLMGMGDGGFQPERRITVATTPIWVGVADFNGDTLPDLFVISIDSLPEVVAVLLGTGDGNFQQGVVLSSELFPARGATGDFNADGRLDLALTGVNVSQSEQPGMTAVFLGNGDGSFEQESDFGVGPGPTAIALDDFNGDGVEDAVVANGSSSGDVSVLLGQGDGSFGPEKRYGVGYGPMALATGDLNGDGKGDLVVTKGSFALQIMLGLGDGRFAREFPLPSGMFSSSAVAGDFDDDGNEDFMVAETNPSGLVLFHGRGNGEFEISAQFDLPGPPETIVTGDLNEDGLPDLAVTNSPSAILPGIVSILLGRGGGSFEAQPPSIVEERPGPLALADIDGDHHLDLIVGNAGRLSVLVLGGRGDGSFHPLTRIVFSAIPTNFTPVDLNRDGRVDLVVALTSLQFSPGAVTPLMNDGSGGFTTVDSYPVGFNPISIGAADFNHDGKTDLVIGDMSGGSDWFFQGQGDGTFLARAVDDRAGESVVIGDFDGDGEMDWGGASSLGHEVRVRFGSGDGNFSVPQRFGTGIGPHSIMSGDFDRNGSLDLAVLERSALLVLPNQLSPPNRPPTAAAGPDLTRECTLPEGALVDLDGSSSSDPDGNGENGIKTYEWYENFDQPGQVLLGSEVSIQVTLPLGIHVVTLRVTDGAGATGIDQVVITVRDTTPPLIPLGVTPDVLWPPDHRMVQVAASVTAVDACSTPALSLIFITSDEADDAAGNGDGNTVRDIQGADLGTLDLDFQLRAERDAHGDGRTYAITYAAVDGSGNRSSATSIVFVPRDQGEVTEPGARRLLDVPPAAVACSHQEAIPILRKRGIP